MQILKRLIKEIVNIINKKAKNQDAKIIFDDTKPTTIPIRKVDISKAKKLLGFEKKISLEEGLALTIEWYKKNAI